MRDLSAWTPERRAELLATLDGKRNDSEFKDLVAMAAELAGFSQTVLRMYEVRDCLERFAMLIAITGMIAEEAMK